MGIRVRMISVGLLALLLAAIAFRPARHRVLDIGDPALAAAKIRLAPVEDVARVIDRHREIEPLLIAIAGRQDADDPAVAIEHRSAAVSRIGGGV